MNENKTDLILSKIREYNRIVISRHIRPDGDAVGSTLGLKEIIKATWPEKEVYVIGDDHSQYMAFLGKEDDQIPQKMYEDALVIVLDSGTEDRISNSLYKCGKEIVKIDHHIEVMPYGDISWVEDFRSSVCEMVTAFYMRYSDVLTLNSTAALMLYAGMVTDSGRFRFDSTLPDTMRCAAVLLERKINTEMLFANLYLEEFDYFKFQSYVFGQMKRTENGVAYLYVDKSMQEQWNLNNEQASNTVSFMDSIKGSIIWLAFIDNADGTIRVRLRSRFVTVNKLAEKYHGGGHACASGATCYSLDEMASLIRDADALIKQYKMDNEGWL